MLKKYMGIVSICVSFGLHAMQPQLTTSGKLKKIDKSRYLQILSSDGFSKESIKRFFSDYNGFYGGDCYMFNVGVKLVLDRDCGRCLSELLDTYEQSHEFLTCRSKASKKSIVHILFEHVDTKNFAQFFKDAHRIIALHNSLAKVVDGDGKLPTVRDNTLSLLDKKIFEDLLTNYHQKDFVESGLFTYFLNNQKFEEAQKLLAAYDAIKSDYLTNTTTESDQTYVHFIVSLMQKDNFIMYLDILSKVLALYPNLKDKTDKDGRLPLFYIHDDPSDEQRLTDDQIACLKKIFELETLKKKTSIFTFMKKNI